ncbi:MAG: hypothetical protein ACR2PT_19885 [Endozoicomonas sp.]
MIRTWPFTGTFHPGHASISLKETSANKKTADHTYLSWWPIYKSESFREKVIEKLGLDPLVYQKAKMQMSYKVDKFDELSNRAEELLEAGRTPRPRQVYIPSTKRWGVQADKVYVPFSGPNRNTVTGREVFYLFGLDQQKMASYTEYLRDSAASGQEKYGILSANNCSGMVLKALRKGGANSYIRTDDALFVTDPNNVHLIAIRLQERVDGLNEKANYLFRQLDWNRELVKPFQGLEDNPHYLNELSRVWAARQYPNLSPRIQEKIATIQKMLVDMDGVEVSTDTLTPKAIALVEEIYDAVDGEDLDYELTSAMAPAFAALAHVRGLMKKAYEM